MHRRLRRLSSCGARACPRMQQHRPLCPQPRNVAGGLAVSLAACPVPNSTASRQLPSPQYCQQLRLTRRMLEAPLQELLKGATCSAAGWAYARRMSAAVQPEAVHVAGRSRFFRNVGATGVLAVCALLQTPGAEQHSVHRSAASVHVCTGLLPVCTGLLPV